MRKKRGCSGLTPTYWIFKNQLWVGAGTEMRTQYLPAHCLMTWSCATRANVMVDSLCYFSFQPVLHGWCSKGCCMYYHVCGMVHIKDPLLLIGNRVDHVVAAVGFLSRYLNEPLPYNLMLYNHKQYVLSALLNKTFQWKHATRDISGSRLNT